MIQSLTEYKENNVESLSYGKYSVYGTTGTGVKKILIKCTDAGNNKYNLYTFAFSNDPTQSAQDSGQLYPVLAFENLTGNVPASPIEAWNDILYQAGVDDWVETDGITALIFVNSAVAELESTTGQHYTVNN